jgi:hypothetical protein
MTYTRDRNWLPYRGINILIHIMNVTPYGIDPHKVNFPASIRLMKLTFLRIIHMVRTTDALEKYVDYFCTVEGHLTPYDIRPSPSRTRKYVTANCR